MKTTTKEGVVFIHEDGEPVVVIRGNGSVTYYKLEKMGISGHEELWGADNVQPYETITKTVG